MTSTSDLSSSGRSRRPLTVSASRLLRLTVPLAVSVLRALPRAARFGLMVHIARLLRPAFRRANLGRWHRTRLTSSAADTSLFACCELLDRRGILYDPQLEVVGEAALDAALQRGRGLILLTVHGLLSNLLIRYYEVERPLAPTMVAVSDRTSFVGGAGRRPDVVMPSPSFLVQMRTRLRNRQVVFAMVDLDQDHSRALHFTTPQGPITVTDSMLRLAVRLDVPVLFTTCHVEGGAVVLRIEEVTAASGQLHEMTVALVARIEADMARVAAAESSFIRRIRF